MTTTRLVVVNLCVTKLIMKIAYLIQKLFVWFSSFERPLLPQIYRYHFINLQRFFCYLRNIFRSLIIFFNNATTSREIHPWFHSVSTNATHLCCRTREDFLTKLTLLFKERKVWLWAGTCFSKVPRTFLDRKASCQTAIHSFWKADLLRCF